MVINYENVEILANCNRRNVRLFLEASFSKENSLSINRHLEIHTYYNEIINKYAKKLVAIWVYMYVFIFMHEYVYMYVA